MTKKPIRHGLDVLRGPDWKLRLFTRKGAEHYARRAAAQYKPAGFWCGLVVDCGAYWRVSIGGQLYRL